jgi:mannose-6-phosphate isomerase-like protein (cupin superfamily)
MDPVFLQNRHTGEQLELRRVARDGQIWVALRGRLPPHRQGPPLHVHYQEVEEGQVMAGTLSAVLNGRQLQVGVGETASFPAGSVHRWWNDGEETLVFEGHARPAVDLDLYLQAVFDVLNSGTSDRPPLFYMAHVVWRHRRTQAVLLLPRPIQAVVLPVIVLIGTILGRYRGTNWPGSPARCREAPIIAEDV